MTLTITITPEKEAAYHALAKAQGLSVEQWLTQLADQAAPVASPSKTPAAATSDPQQLSPARRKHISEIIGEIMSDVPPEVMATMPTDGASEHDHYLYGWPKRNS